ncbi:MAG: hypothetical protein ACYDAC_00450 [Candidatus Dormibacteria bacterium]
MARTRATGDITADVATVAIEGDTLTIDHLTLRDAELAAFVADHHEDARSSLVITGLRVGLLALRSSGLTINVDYIQKEFARLLRQTDESHERAAEEVERQFRDVFADGDGRLPRTLEKFLGDKGSFRRFVDDLFDEDRRDSAIGRIRAVLEGYFDGDGAVVARMLDPRREDSPLHGFRTEVREQLKELTEQVVRLEAAREARADERARGTQKGLDFEDAVEERLAAIAHGCGDVIEATGRVVGHELRSRKGDFVLTINPSWTRGLPLRVAVEAKSGSKNLIKLCRELDAARVNRDAAVAVAVFAAGQAPTGCAPFTLHGEHVICEVDADDPDDRTLDAAIRLARALALVASRERSGDLDLAAVQRHLDDARAHLRAVSSMKTKLTSIGNASSEVSEALEVMRNQVLACVGGIETEIASRAAAAEQRDVA